MRIAMAQLNQRLGDIEGNARALLHAIGEGRRDGAALVVTPELSLCGYPPEDLVLRPAFLDACASELTALAAEVTGTTAIVGFPEYEAGARYNAVAVLRHGGVAAVYRKHHLPNYTVFDEDRYFEPGRDPCVFDVDGVRCGIVICEDCWFPDPALQSRAAGAPLVIVPSGAPSPPPPPAARAAPAAARVRATHVPVGYATRVGCRGGLASDA